MGRRTNLLGGETPRAGRLRGSACSELKPAARGGTSVCAPPCDLRAAGGGGGGEGGKARLGVGWAVQRQLPSAAGYRGTRRWRAGHGAVGSSAPRHRPSNSLLLAFLLQRRCARLDKIYPPFRTRTKRRSVRRTSHTAAGRGGGGEVSAFCKSSSSWKAYAAAFPTTTT